ncbi:uncharacterized protein AKAME5_002620800 [Lates japonicus]|uniref:Ig-like domain-containing protein n=1 Tax=Lates japonicus TaxID=270547 RepID=A0AAD3NL20_LATJO|nr:uncharacterized protein AKAME5_002620800 [Lates japonicus]
MSRRKETPEEIRKKLTHSTADRFLYQSLSLCYRIFGSGTKLYVTDEAVVKPVVSVYPAASRAHLEGKTSLLCLASGMFPPLVQFSWKRQDGSSAEGEQLELRARTHHLHLAG